MWGFKGNKKARKFGLSEKGSNQICTLHLFTVHVMRGSADFSSIWIPDTLALTTTTSERKTGYN